jgi:hypothetical protein
VRILASAPPRNKTPCGRMIAIVPSLFCSREKYHHL